MTFLPLDLHFHLHFLKAYIIICAVLFIMFIVNSENKRLLQYRITPQCDLLIAIPSYSTYHHFTAGFWQVHRKELYW